MFRTRSSEILTIANSAYSTKSYFTFDEWMACRQAVIDRQDLANIDRENRRKTATDLR